MLLKLLFYLLNSTFFKGSAPTYLTYPTFATSSIKHRQLASREYGGGGDPPCVASCKINTT